MNRIFNRRQFLAATTTVTAGLGLGLVSSRARAAQPEFKTKLKKALIVQKPTEEGLKKLKDAGFDGVEGGVIPEADAEKARAVADKLGMKIHSVIRGWAEFNSTDAAKVESGFKVSEDGLRAAHGFGADAMLLVPCRIGGLKMPKPREFRFEFDETTGLISKVAAGDNAPYADYIAAHNRAITTSTEHVKRLIPLAEKLGVVIALENVWNNLWTQPGLFRQFVASFRSPWVKAYFDIGNHVKYAPPEEWITTLGPLLAKLHVKDFKLNDDPGGDGKFVNIREGSVSWPVVRAAIEKVGYNGWLTIEGGNCTTEEHSQRLDLIIAGK
ncbi:MAG: sugar phosphate isomerase/epimerase [Verrucomicrobia bacterium]|nr:sugar phosphate isomerase/epimerase [Verrucomicrobiota bacterium]